MNARTYLIQIRDLKEDIQRIQTEIRMIDLKNQSPGAVRYDRIRVQSASENMMEQGILQKLKAVKRLEKVLDIYTQKYNQIIAEINGLENRTNRKILKLYYLDGMSVRKISKKLNYSEDWTYHLLTRARREFAQKYL